MTHLNGGTNQERDGFRRNECGEEGCDSDRPKWQGLVALSLVTSGLFYGCLVAGVMHSAPSDSFAVAPLGCRVEGSLHVLQCILDRNSKQRKRGRKVKRGAITAEYCNQGI